MKKFWVDQVVTEIRDLPEEELINACLAENIPLSRVKKTKEGLSVTVRSRDCRRFLGLIRQRKGKAKIKEKNGLSFWGLSLLRRQGLLLGLAAGGALLYLGLSYIWSYDISGNECYTDEDVIALVERHGIHIGLQKDSVDYEEITKDILKERNGELSWFWMRPKGTVLEIRLKEKDNAFIDYDRTADLTAAKDGIVNEILVLEGTPMVQVGERVFKGEVLIRGVEYDEWAKNEEGVYEPDGNGRGIRAQGSVQGLVQYESSGICCLTEHFLTETGEMHKNYRLWKNDEEIRSFGHTQEIALEKVIWEKCLRIGDDIWCVQALESRAQILDTKHYELNEAYQCSLRRAEQALAEYDLPADGIVSRRSFLKSDGGRKLVRVGINATVKEELTAVEYR